MELLNTTSLVNQYFPKSIGSTFVTLSYFPLYKAITLINRFSKRKQMFLANQVNNVFGECFPTVFCSQFKLFKTFKVGVPPFLLTDNSSQRLPLPFGLTKELHLNLRHEH
jgi:hypothetical protein